MTRLKSAETAGKDVVICICGMAGSGKSTVAKRLAKKYGLRYYSGGDALKALAAEKGYKSVERGWWETAEGLHFLKRRDENSKFDCIVDKRLLKEAKKGNIILDSWTMPWLLKSGFKIWLEASPEKRAKRIGQRDHLDLDKALVAMREKEKRTKTIYKRLYGFSLGEDFAPFLLILDTNCLSAEEVFRVLCMVMDNVILKKGISHLSKH
ncbi:cytidylate kinase family protein [Candidatus Bathyarchaeota archaeon]|nr:cytidylate kinase family protein [Candidatus Bathyarchaeota archaeon]